MAVITFLLPKSFASTARIRVEKAGANEAIRGQPDDYVFLTSELEVLGSQLVLSNVIERLHLDERWGQLFNAGIDPASQAVTPPKGGWNNPASSETMAACRSFPSEPLGPRGSWLWRTS